MRAPPPRRSLIRLLRLSVSLLALPLAAQAPADSLSRPGLTIPCPTSVGDTLASVEAPAAFLSGAATAASRIELRFTGDVPTVARAALQRAADLWASYLESAVPIVVDVDWRDEGDAGLLASAGPTTFFRDFGAGAEPGLWYPVALAEAIAGRDLNDLADADIRVTVNAGADWYFGLDARPPRTQTDLVTVALHELGHGLGFISSADTLARGAELGIGFGGRFVVYDLGLVEAPGRRLSDGRLFDNPSERLLAAVTEDELTWVGPTVLDRNGGPAPLFAPRAFDIGSSVSHFDERAYRPGDANALMTPFLARGEAAHQPGAVGLALLADLGWAVRFELASATGQTQAAAPAVAYPNPVRDGRLYLAVAPSAPPTLAVYDALGRSVLRVTGVAEGGAVGFDVSRLPAGTYVARGAGGAFVFAKR